eukprot:TRINITY_DN7782_c0_g1_i1.p1 TRINITY_DN7782_c0_g1~~TRINITY_DN7782_c0_g1_i1.p1  ORF type:complete len:117 (+),score=37.24 TRINITY_DN7782_c0_g1_i1:101-451(+)
MSKVKCSHLLVKHQGSRRPASWKDPEGKIIQQRSKADAIKLLQEYRSQIKEDKSNFADLASKHSDCGSASSGGDLGFFGKGEMQAAFEEAAFKLKVGELSQVVDTDSGVHIIYRTA